MKSDNNIVELIDVMMSNIAGKKIFDGLDFSLPAGQTAVIMGPTGSGKTSLIELIIGRRKPESGTVMVFNRKIETGGERQLSEIRNRIGGVGGIFQPISYQTVRENLVYPLILRGISASSRKRRALNILSQLNLLSKKNEKVRNLSQGEKILLMLGRAIVADQPLLLIDEPRAGLDAEMSSSVSAMLKRLAVAGHSLMVLTSSQTDLPVAYASRYRIENGKLE